MRLKDLELLSLCFKGERSFLDMNADTRHREGSTCRSDYGYRMAFSIGVFYNIPFSFLSSYLHDEGRGVLLRIA
jgi:hypothetical protein